MDESAGGPGPHDVEPQKMQPPPVLLPTVTADARCRGCGYQLSGLTSDRNCPECGMPILRSISGNLLVYSPQEYVAALYRGLVCILIAGLVHFGLISLGIVTDFAFRFGRGGAAPPASLDAFGTIMNVLVALLSLYGWWLFSTPDPAIISGDKGDTPRLIVRGTVIIQMVSTLLSLMGVFGTKNPSVNILITVGVIGGLLALAVQFFASMLYLRWMAPRLPDAEIESRTQRYMWLLPVLFIVVCFVGALISTTLYLLLLNRVRLRLVRIQSEQFARYGTIS